MSAVKNLICLLALFLFIAAKPLSAAETGGYKIGLMCPITGKWASEGQDMRNIVSLLVDEANKKGGVNGHKITLIEADDAGDPRTAALAAQKLVSAGVIAIIGTYGSAVTEASQNIIAEAGIVQISTGSTSVRLTEKGLPLFFRTSPRDDDQGKVAAAEIRRGGYKSVAILHDNSSYAKGLAEESREALKKSGPKVVFFDALTPSERDYTAVLTKLKIAEPDLIFFTGYYPETGMLLRQKDEIGWTIPMIGGDAANHQDLVKIAGNKAANGYSFISPPLPQDLDTTEAKEFLALYKKRHNNVPVSVWAVLAGDAFKVVEAALAAGKDTPQTMGAWLKTLKGLPCLSGTVGFDSKGDRVGEFYRKYTVNDKGDFVLQPQ